MFYLNLAFVVFYVFIKPFESVIIETTYDQTDQQCDFYNETLTDKVWFVRSPYNCRVYHLCAFYKQFTLTCAEGLYFDENIDSCNFESLVSCQLNNNNLQLSDVKNNQSDTSNTNYYYNIDDSAYLDKNSYENSNDDVASEKSGDTAKLWPEIEKIILSTLISTKSMPSSYISTTPSTITSTKSTTTTTITTTTKTSATTSSSTTTTTPLTHWYNNPFSPVTFLLFTYQNNPKYPSSKKYSNVWPDKNNVFYNVKSSNYSNSYVLLNQQQQEKNEQEKSSFNLPSLFEETNKQKDINKIYGISSAYNQNLNREINKLFDSLVQNTTIAVTSTVPSTSSTNLKIDSVENQQNKLDAWWLAPKKCIPGFIHKMMHRENCALYYECNSNGSQIEKACPYPLLFDEFSNQCKSYNLVNCGKRKEAKHLCDYELSSLSKINTTTVKKCSSYPNCKNLIDGLYPTENCQNYFQCKNERTLRVLSCPFDRERNQSLRFNIMTRRCDYIENVPMNCGGYSIQIDIYTGKMKCPIIGSSTSDLSYELKDIYYKHPTKCNLFIECDKGNMTILECPTGTHFSPVYQSCVHPSISNCNPLFVSSSSTTPINQLSNFDNDEMSNTNKSLTSQTNKKLSDSINFNTDTDANIIYSNEESNESNQDEYNNEEEINNSENDESITSTFIDTTSITIIETTTPLTITKSLQSTSVLDDDINNNDNVVSHLNDNSTDINYYSSISTTTSEINKLADDNFITNNSTQVV